MSELTDHTAPERDPIPEINRLSLTDIADSLGRGIADFRAAPLFGLFFSAVYVLGGFFMIWLGAGHVTWVLATSLGFPLYAPFAAVGLYEVSRRIEAGEPLNWWGILGVVWAERGREIPWAGAVIVIYFLFWTFLAHMIFALLMGLSAMRNVSQGYEIFLTTNGLMMIGLELIVGAVLAFLLFALTVVNLPLLLEKNIDFVTAMLLSLKTVQQNLFVMLCWALFIAVVSLIALIPYFLGLVIALPILGHASWHVYRAALGQR